ncbi:hypothetical protein [Rhodoferax ferrireducens]|uniref:hypothetical protein n=1 Tax=Rhodoferax ferrireducens TaxID=192843 RepID=UPI000E0D7AAA|nr:hypothetical protein [Rhodoferax ferrireducens]
MKEDIFLKPPFTSVMPATLDHYHAVTSIRKYGAIKHASAVAHAMLAVGSARTESEAVGMANNEVARVERIDQGLLVNRMAHQQLQADENNSLKLPKMRALPLYS